jgi:hypothetical protein
VRDVSLTLTRWSAAGVGLTLHGPAELAEQLLVGLPARVAVRPRVDAKGLIGNVAGLERDVLEGE